MIAWDYRSFFCPRVCITIIPQLMALFTSSQILKIETGLAFL